jgi:hypothetical protein
MNIAEVFVIHLLTLHAPNGQMIELNPAEVSSVRMPQDQAVKTRHFPPTTHCIVVMTNGLFNAVMETCEQVDALLANAEGKERQK